MSFALHFCKSNQISNTSAMHWVESLNNFRKRIIQWELCISLDNVSWIMTTQLLHLLNWLISFSHECSMVITELFSHFILGKTGTTLSLPKKKKNDQISEIWTDNNRFIFCISHIPICAFMNVICILVKHHFMRLAQNSYPYVQMVPPFYLNVQIQYFYPLLYS